MAATVWMTLVGGNQECIRQGVTERPSNMLDDDELKTRRLGDIAKS